MTQRIDAARDPYPELVFNETAQQGKTVQIDWEKVKVDIGGWCKMLMGLVLELTVKVDAVALNMTGPLAGAALYDVLERFDFGMESHIVIDGASGSRLRHDDERCAGGAQTMPADTEPADVPDADATALSRTVFIPVLFTPASLPQGAEMDGAFPVKALRYTDMRFRFASGELAPGVTISSIDVKVHALTRAAHKVTLPTNWQIRRAEEVRKDFVFKPLAGYLYYADIMDAAEPDHGRYSQLELTIGREKLPTLANPAAAVSLRSALAYRRDPAHYFIDADSPPYIPLIQSIPRDALASKQPTGPIRLRFERTGAASTDIVYRTRGTRHEGWRSTLFQRLDIIPGEDQGQQLQAADGGKVPALLRPHMAEEVVWPGMQADFPAVVEARRHKYPDTLGGV